jgi:uncharacterized membrane protein
VVLIFDVLFWMYAAYAWLTNMVPPDRPARRLMLMVGMAAFLVCALAVPRAFDGGGVAFGLGYLLVVVVHGGLYAEVAGAAVLWFAAPNALAALSLLVAGLLDGPAAYALWAVPIVNQFVTPRISARAAPRLRVRPAHFVERHGLLLLVALGLAGAGGMLVHALAGHAAGPSSLRLLNLGAQWAHLLAVGVWIGGLVWLLAALVVRTTARSTREVVVGFSRLAGISLAVVVATGVARSVDEVGGWRRLLDSGFGRALDLKLVLFTGLVALGARNRYLLVPQFEAGRREAPAAARLRRSVGGELGLAAAVMAAAALLSQLAPGVPAGSTRAEPAATPVLEASGADWATTVRVTLTVTPGAAGPNRFTATVADFDTGTVLAVDRVELAGAPAAHPELGSARLELTEAAGGRWLGQGRLLSLAGRWDLTTTIQRPTGGITVPLTLDVPPAAPS